MSALLGQLTDETAQEPALTKRQKSRFVCFEQQFFVAAPRASHAREHRSTTEQKAIGFNRGRCAESLMTCRSCKNLS
jgi:hypothetical protein